MSENIHNNENLEKFSEVAPLDGISNVNGNKKISHQNFLIIWLKLDFSYSVKMDHFEEFLNFAKQNI